MAAPIAHIFLAIQMLMGPFKGMFDEKEFIIGTSFPDIRYLKVVERAKTHSSGVTLTDIMHEHDSFKAGMLFHSFVDEKREEYISRHELYQKIPTFRFATQALKLAEDKLLRAYFDISPYISYFNEILKQETDYHIRTEHIRVWHTYLQVYFQDACSVQEVISKYFDLHDPSAWRIKKLNKVTFCTQAT